MFIVKRELFRATKPTPHRQHEPSAGLPTDTGELFATSRVEQRRTL